MNICIFGASIAYGAYDLEKGGWANRLRIYLDNKDYDGETYNLGISGDTTRGLLARLEAEASIRNPKAIIFSIGTNDSTLLIKEGQNWVPIEEFENNLRQIFSQAKKYTSELIFAGIAPVDEEKTSPIPWATNIIYKNSEIEKYNERVKNICQEQNVKFIDLYSEMIKMDYKNMLCDGLHPNSEGHRWVAEKIIGEINL